MKDGYSALKQKGETDQDDDIDYIRPTIEWNGLHILKIIIGAGIGSTLQFYTYCLVSYFEPELKYAYFPSSSELIKGNQIMNTISVTKLQFVMRNNILNYCYCC